MGETEGDVVPGESRPSEDREVAGSQDTLQVPTQKKRKLKSPTPGSLRGRSATPIHGRSQTPFTLYMTRRSATPSTWRSITPFINREEKEKTPFELGRDIKTQIISNKAVFDRALIMDISEPEEIQKPVRYITSDLSVIDRAAVMDVSNVEVIYVVEEYEEYEEEEIEEVIEEVKPKKKGSKGKKGARTPRRSIDKDSSPLGVTSDAEDIGDVADDREESVDLDEADEPAKKGKKKAAPKKKEKKEKSPSPKLSLKLEIGGGQKASKKMFEQQQQQQGAGPKPPPKKSKLALQMEEQAKAAAKAAEEEAAKAKPKGETFEERQKRLKAEQEEQEELERLEAERLAQEEAEAEAEREAEGEDDGEDYNEYGDEGDGENPEDGEYGGENGEGGDDGRDGEEGGDEEGDEVADLPEKRRGSDSSEDFTRPDPDDEEHWKRIAEEEGEEFMLQMRKYSLLKRRSEKERDAEWQKRREQARNPRFIIYLSDRTAPVGKNVRLACAVDGPELSVKWYKDKKQLERDASHRIINNNNILALEIINPSSLDSGEYQCVIANMNDEVVSSCIVTIYEIFKDEPQPPTFRLVKEYYHLRDDELTIECHVHGVPRPRVTWWRGAFEVTPSYKFTILEEAHGVCKLLIYKPSNRDGGLYTCKAVNNCGEAVISHSVEVGKNLHYHVPGIFHARDRIQQDKGKQARKAMEEALKSKAESDQRRAEAEIQEPKYKSYSAANEPLVPPKQKLKFATQLRDRMALVGATVKFACTVIGPSPACRWMKDDAWVVFGPTVRNLSEEGKAILEMQNVTPESSGVYKCIAKNEHCEIETSCYFKVYSAQADGDEQEPMFALPLRDVYHSSQNDLIIDTKVRGNPRPIISWLKDEIPVVLDDRVVQIEHLDGLCELIINKPTQNDAGVYSCIAENKLGSQKITHTVVVDVVQGSRRSSVLSSIMSDAEGRARREGGDDEKLPPKPRKMDGAEEETTYERRSRMPDVTPKQQLYFIAHPSNRFVAEGSRVKLQAVIGGPDPTMRWQKDDQNVTYGPKIRNQNRDSLAVLEFLNAQPEDSGKYTIIASNEFCKITTSAQLQVYQSKVNTDVGPVFIRSLKDTYHLNTNELVLETGIRGQPNPEIQWFKDSIEIQNGGRYQMLEHQDGTLELFIDKPSNKDSGKYVIKAENRAGKMEISHYVLFEGKEHHIADNIHGVFHHDPALMRPKHEEEEEKPKTVTAPKPPPASAADGSESEAEGAGGRRRSRARKEDEADAGSLSADYTSDTGSLKKREKVIGIHFATMLRDSVIAEGSKVRISCFLDAKEPQVKWFKDNEQIQNTPKMRGRYSEGLCLLEIQSATLEDSGEYKCWGRDETGEASTICKVEVYADPGTGDVAPTFTRNIKETFHGKINEIQLDCHVRGLPTPEVTWTKDGVKVEPNDKYQQVDHDDGTCELFVADPVPMDSGKYTCQAENREGKAEIVHIVTIEPKRVRPPSPTRPPVKPAGEETEEEREEREQRKKKAKEEMEEASASRREVPPPPDLRKQLYFRNFLSNRTVKSGSNVKWMVNIDGPEPVARWFHGDQPIAFGPKSKMSCQDGIAWLNLVGVTEEDAGEYTLKVRGPENEIISTCNLFVYSTGKEEMVPPTFTVGIKDNYSLNENELVLDCRVRGKPRPEIQWMKGNEVIEKGSKYQQIDQEDGYSKLIINNPTEKDSGLYSCIARNEAAENKITHQVDFMGRERFTLEKTHGFYHRDPNKPHFLTPLGNQTVCPGGTICISAEFMQTSTPIEVHWFRERQSLHGQPNVKTFMDKGVYTLAIMNATPDLEGTYTCRASNAFGRIETTATVDVAANVEKEERPPLFLSRPDNEMKIAVGDPFSISFRIAGEPKPKLTFMKGTRDITKSERISKEVSDDYTRFTVQKSQISDSGTYFVVARNNFGTDRIFVTVTVMPRARSETPTTPLWGLPLESYSDTSYFRDPPGPISTEPLIVDSGKTHISLSWGKPISNNSAPVIAYKVDAWIKGHDGGAIWKELGFTPINSFDAFNLKPNVEYHFRVTPKNRYGWGPSVQTTTPVQVGGAESLPEFVKILPGQLKALLGSELLLECAVRGAPRPHVAWYKDGIHLSTTAERIKIRQQGTTCTLLITQVSEIDAGRYTCEATNSKGRVSTFARIQVVADSKVYAADTKLKEIIHNQSAAKSGDTLPIFTMRLRDRRVQFTYPVRLTCQVIGYPTPQVTWFKNGELVETNRRCVITEDGQFHTLELMNTQLDDAGLYTCTAKNELGSVSCNCTLVVDKGIRAYITPEFYMPLDPLYIFEEGKEIRLTAKVEAYPSVGVSWHRNGVKLRPSRRISVSLDCNGFVELTIAEATKLDAGIYMCVASNAVGRVESSCRVAIEETDEPIKKQLAVPMIKTTDMPYSKEPMFVVKPRSSEAYEGDTVIIFCEVVGDPKPEVIWLRDFLNPEYYKDAPHFRRVGDGPEYRLEIPSAKLDFTGTYSVIANNCHGEVKAVISLQIFAKDILSKSFMEKGSIRQGNVETLPRFLRHLRDLRCCDGDAITLEGHVEALPEPIIIWEKDGHVLHSNKDLTMSYDGIKATLSISRVYPEDEGEYTCVAKNNIGRTLSSACIIVDVPEENENMLSRQLSRPAALLSANSTPRSTPRSTPNRGFSPMPLSYRNSSIDFDGGTGSVRRVSITGRQAIAAPKFLAIPHNRVVEEGDSVRFQCAIAGHPMPWATWDKEGVIITPTARIVVKEVNDLRFLDINEVTFDDAGLYRITLENDYGRIEATARLDVIGSSRYSKSPSARSLRASSGRRNAHLHRRIMGYSTAIGGRMALAAGYRGSSVPSCKFYKNGLELHEDEDERIQICINTKEVKLFIDNVSEADEGIYTCILQNPNDETLITTTIVKFHKAKNCLTMYGEDEHETPQIIKALPKMIEAIEMETVDLQFTLKCSEPYTVTWKRNGEIIDDCEDFSYIDHGNGEICLRISDAFDIDSGLYTCDVNTISGLACSTSSHLSIVAAAENDHTINAEDNKLFILKSPLPVITTTNNNDCSTVTFCSKVYPFDADVSWIICGHEITKADAPTCTLESCETDGVRILRINNIEEFGHILNVKTPNCGNFLGGGYGGEVQLIISHPGKNEPTLRAYTSLIVWPQSISTTTTNAQSTSTTTPTTTKATTTKMSIDKTINTIAEENNYKQTQRPPRILESPSDCIAALIGDSINLSVSFETVEQARVTWYKGSRTVTEGGSLSIKNSSTGSTLSFSEISADDSGKYTIEIMNKYGIEMAVVSVSVEGPPDPPSGKPSISQGPDRISIAWCGSPYDGGCIVNGFIIEMQQIINEEEEVPENEFAWQEIARVVDSLAYTVKDLQPEIVYRFRVRAENVHGPSMPSLPSDPVRIGKTIIQRNSNNDFSNSISIKAGGDFKARFKIIEELGKGRFGIVYKVEEIESPHQVLAAKVIKCIKAQDRKKVQEEISIMKSLQHPKLLQLAASFESPREIVMVMEYITGGELFERVVADDFTLTERDCILFLRQICEGVAYMHSQSIVHLDLKPENIMCHTRTSHQIKIIDFGLAQRLSGDSPVRVLFGTPEFIPPEIISYEPIGFKSDMWSIGVICYVLLSGLSPFMGDSDVETFTNITRADYDFDDDAFDCVSSEAKDFIAHLLLHRKEERWTALECLESTWLTQVHDEARLSNNRICTDKLKKFIIRRKWQKTGNAIRALGRMATLSASRRNSAVGSNPSSPRPSITGASILHPNVTLQMGSLHEEDDDFNEETSKIAPRHIHQRTLRMRDKSLCSERSDSGYSECSNCSGNLPCQCQHIEREYERDAIDHHVGMGYGTTTGDLTFSIAVPHDVLKSKLEEIVTHEVEKSTIKQFEDLSINKKPEKVELQQPPQSTSSTTTTTNPFKSYSPLRSPSPSKSTIPEPIMRSDFTNTIKMRKKSLEKSVKTREHVVKTNQQQTKIHLQSPGRVSRLRSKFDNKTVSSTKVAVAANNCTKMNTVQSVAELSQSCKNASLTTTTTTVKLAACNNKTTGATTNKSSSTTSHISNSQRNLSPARLSERVRQATERLSKQHTISSSIRCNSPQTAAAAPPNNNDTNNNNSVPP